MKRFLSLILCVILTLPMGLPAQAEDRFTAITTRQELEAIAEDPEGFYRLEADIDLGSGNWTPIPFMGVLDGNDHTIYNLTVTEPSEETAVTVDGNKKEYNTHFAALFSVTKNADIKKLNVIGANIHVETDDHCFAAVIAGSMENTHISHCYAEGRVNLYTTNVMVGVGGVAGFGTGSISDCRTDVTLTFGDRSDRDSGLRCEQFMGAILACGNCDLWDNFVKIQGFGSCWGYVHNGGLVGMHYRWNKEDPVGEIVGNHVEGQITFFENNPDRRAYCGGFWGELLSAPPRLQKNLQKFKRNEVRGAKEELPDHNCKNPDYEVSAVPHKEDAWGYTLHQCKTCGYLYRDHYQAPGHIPGEWELLRDSTYEKEGRQQLHCAVCDEIIDHQPVPTKTKANLIILSEDNLKINYKEVYLLKGFVRPKDALNTEVSWSTSDSSVATVDENGNVTGIHPGIAEIICTSQDGYTSSTCNVVVKYSLLQWFIKIFLFGWIWY